MSTVEDGTGPSPASSRDAGGGNTAGGGSAPPARRWGRDAALAVILALITLVASFGGSFIGGYYAYRAATSTQRQQEKTDRDTAARSERANVYVQYLAASNQFSIASNRIAVARTGTLKVDGHDFPKADFDAWNTARSKWQGAVNMLYVYGSDDAWAAHRKLAATLPNGLDATAGFAEALSPIDGAAFLLAYQQFQEVFCKEVPAVPRSGC